MQKKNARVFLHKRSLGGCGWVARAAHLKKPRRGFFAAGTDGGGRCCSNPPATIPLICFYKTETPASGSDAGVLGGRGWIARAAHLKKPRRGFFAAGTDGGGRCCSNPPATIPLICFYKTETPAPGSDTGVLGGRGWIARAAHLKKPRRGFFAAGTDSGGRCCSNPPATIPLICFYKTETPAPGSDAGVLGGAKQPKSEPLPSGASLAAISSNVMVFVPSL